MKGDDEVPITRTHRHDQLITLVRILRIERCEVEVIAFCKLNIWPVRWIPGWIENLRREYAGFRAKWDDCQYVAGLVEWTSDILHPAPCN